MVGQHVNFVDHIDLEARIGRRIDRLFKQLRHFIDAAVGSRIHFDVIDEAPGIDGNACFARAAGLGGDSRLAIERLGKDTRQRGLADPARSGKQIRVMQSLLLQRMRERPHDMLLPDERLKALGAILSGKDLIRHVQAGG